MSIPIITIDGPGGAGKGEAGRSLAKDLGFNYLDTGFYYRWVAVRAAMRNIDPLNKNAIVNMAEDLFREIDRMQHPTHLIRTPEAAMGAARLGRYEEVREILNKYFHSRVTEPGMVIDGRDMGEVVFPNADVKFYVTARTQERSERLNTDFEELEERDELVPALRAEKSFFVDTTGVSIEDAASEMLSTARMVLNRRQQ